MSRTQLLSLVGVCSLSLLAACGADNAGLESGTLGDIGSPSPSGPIVGSGAQAGTLTAGDWDDNLNFDIYEQYVSGYVSRDPSIPKIDSSGRVVIKVLTSAGEPVSNALVQVKSATGTFLTAPTASDGQVLFFPTHDGAAQEKEFTVEVIPPPEQANIAPLVGAAPTGSSEWTFTLPDAMTNAPKVLDVAFVVDATGSMGDEIEFLKAEVQGIADRIQTGFQGVSIRYALIMYRDKGDTYVTQNHDFTADLAAFKATLQEQSADGGGDIPEAMDAAMALVPELSWSEGNAVRMSFLLADAPPHKQDRAAYMGSVNSLRSLGVKLFPIAASGVDAETEFLMRVGAEATMGRYLFLTDDSGVGNSHAEPIIPCYNVQKLNDLVVRVIGSELKGYRIPAQTSEILRSVGSPVEGVCKLSNGSLAYL